eukprot:Hpha_TRINITY_DN27765_c0_g1::TRINITY_DN27765_c0_g1_i1::g.157019::m.157019
MITTPPEGVGTLKAVTVCVDRGLELPRALEPRGPLSPRGVMLKTPSPSPPPSTTTLPKTGFPRSPRRLLDFPASSPRSATSSELPAPLGLSCTQSSTRSGMPPMKSIFTPFSEGCSSYMQLLQMFESETLAVWHDDTGDIAAVRWGGETTGTLYECEERL